MLIIKSINSLRKTIKKVKLKNKKIGFVPTMGAFHEGHLSLMRYSRRCNDISIVSIFVNPKQFGKNEDFTKYPRQEKKDKMLAQKQKVDIIFYPSEEILYPNGYLTYVNVHKLDNVLCGKYRPGHFRGVTTIVAKLLNIVQPDIMYLGQKDAQQVVILKKMIDNLNFPVTIQTCPIIREKDGLAMSSRNSYLNKKQRAEAPILYKSLLNAKKIILLGNKSTKNIIKYIRSNIKKESSCSIDYIECVDANTLNTLKKIKGKVMIALAVKFGKTRLIDNIIFTVK